MQPRVTSLSHGISPNGAAESPHTVFRCSDHRPLPPKKNCPITLLTSRAALPSALSGRHHNFRYILKNWNGSGDSIDLARKFRYNDLHKCMTGRLLLAYADKNEIQDFLKKNGVPKSAPWPENNTEKNFYAELDAIRRKQEITGYYSGCGVAALPIFKDGRVIAALGVLWPDENRKQDVRRLKQLHQFQKEANELLSGKNLWYNIGNEV